ncbi:MAG: penicillin-binding protein 2 [bacterium]|nr:penicillin-binding protein 2 [bacterium]
MKEKRINSLFTLISIISLVFVARLALLQLVKGSEYKQLAKGNYIKADQIEATRGKIYDRKGIVLADNIPSYTIIVDSGSVSMEEYAALSSLLGKTNPGSTGYTIRKVPFDVICKLDEKREDFPHVRVKAQPLRRYLYKEIFSHPIGYIGEISKEEYKSYSGYRLGASIGKLGIEKEYEGFLKGKDGAILIEVDAKGREIGHLSSVPPEAGNDVWLTLDARLQAFVYNILPDRAACVAMDPTTGEVLVWVSKPGFEPNLFSSGNVSEVWKEISEDPRSPLWDRVKNACYPPASIFKLIACACGIEKGIINPNTHQPIPCKGSIVIGRREYKCWEAHGSLNLMDAIIQSCDVYFYQLGMELGIDPICSKAKKIGFGKKVRIDLPGESDGFIPSVEWYDKKYGKGKWGKGIAANLAVGQGEIMVTPLQILYFISGIATKGVLCTPRLVKKVVNFNGDEIFSSTPRYHNLPLNSETIEILREGMLGVVEGAKGTGILSRVPGIEVAGKTGTAQNPHGEDHAWFVAFAPYDNPRICIVVFVENGGKGGSTAAPISGKVIETYLYGKLGI